MDNTYWTARWACAWWRGKPDGANALNNGGAPDGVEVSDGGGTTDGGRTANGDGVLDAGGGPDIAVLSTVSRDGMSNKSE